MREKTKNPIEKILNELASFTSATNASSWESNMIRWPIGATSNSGSSENDFLQRAKVEEENAKAPSTKPYPLNFVTDTIVDTYVNLQRLRKTLKESIKYPDLTSTDKSILKKEIKKVDAIVASLEKMYYNVEKITL